MWQDVIYFGNRHLPIVDTQKIPKVLSSSALSALESSGKLRERGNGDAGARQAECRTDKSPDL